MAKTMNRISIRPDINIWGPWQSSTLIDAIWKDNCYTKDYRLKKEDIVIDIGANIGIFSILAATCGAYVYAFEPNPETFRILKMNVDENKLGNKIKIFNCAVSGKDGSVDLQIPDTGKIYALGSATISENLKNDMRKKQEIAFKSVRTETVSLNTLFEKHLNTKSKIDFLKVDCEGAEYAIFNGLEISNAENILNIAMETHAGYSEKDIVGLMNEKGFAITRYVKRAGHYKTGYCYARHRRNSGPPTAAEFKPVALLKSATFVQVNKALSISAEDSFLLNDTSRPLTFLWKIDGEAIKENRVHFDHFFSVPGVHRIFCTVSNESDMDCQENKVIVLEKEYFQKKVTFQLGREGEKMIAPVMGEATFCLQKSFLPKTWDFDKIIIAIAARNQSIACLGPVLESNGSVFNLKEYYNELEIDSVSTDIDVIFTLKIQKSAEIEVNWWAKKIANDSKIVQALEDNDCLTLGETGSEAHCVINEPKKIIVRNEAFPTDWSPRCLKFGIAAMPVNGRYKPLDGYFEYNGNRKALTGWYTEIAICDFDFKLDMEFSILFKEKRTIKIAWWAE
jgi:FkbM family methyltransferase